MHQNLYLQRRVLHGALVMLERSAVKVARCVLRGERSREAPDLPGGSNGKGDYGELLEGRVDGRVDREPYSLMGFDRRS